MARPVNPKRHYALLGRAVRRMERKGNEDLAKTFAQVLTLIKKSKTAKSPKAWEIVSKLPEDAQQEIFDTRDMLKTAFAA